MHIEMSISRVSNSLNLRLLPTCKKISKMSVLTTSFHPQTRNISQSATPSQSGTIHMSHLNPDIISKIEKQIAEQENDNPEKQRHEEGWEDILQTYKVEGIILRPYTHLLERPGKNIRSSLLDAFNLWLQVPEKPFKLISEVIQMLHNASLLLDDIEDGSELRRGAPTAHKVFGEALTINSANYLYFVALEKVIELNNPEAVKIYTEQMLELHRGQGMEIHWREEGQCPSEEEYRTMVIQKTGGLFNLAVRLMQLFQTKRDPVLAEYNYGELANLMGLYFQIRDDYANLVLDEYTQTKTFAEDLTEGKYNYPIIHAIRNFPGDSKVQSILRQKTQDMELKKYCVSLLEASGSFEYSKMTMTELDERIRREISQLGGNASMMNLMDKLGNWK